MPRTGSGNYTKPYDDVVDGTTIEPLVYNGFVNDVATVLDDPTPLISGGTNAENATDALYNLGAETATQVVDNFDSHVWRPGSFRADAGKSGAPNGTAMFVGHALLNEVVNNPPTNNNVVLEARDMTTGVLYIRSKVAGVWFAWAPLPVPSAAGTTGQLLYNNAGAEAGFAGSSIGAGTLGLTLYSGTFKVRPDGVIHSGGFARVPTDQSVTSSTTPATVAFVPTVAARSYFFDAELYVNCAAAGGVRATIRCTQPVTFINYTGYAIADNAIKGKAAATAIDTVVANTTTTETTGIIVRISGLLTTTASSTGQLEVRFAQSVSNGTATTVLRGSWLRVFEYA